MLRTCEKCQTMFPRNPKESHKQYEGKKCCSYDCASAARCGIVRPASEIKSKYRTVQRNGMT